MRALKAISVALLLALVALPALAAITVSVNADGTVLVTAVGEPDDVEAAWCRMGQEAFLAGWEGVSVTKEVSLAGVSLKGWEASEDEESYTSEELRERC